MCFYHKYFNIYQEFLKLFIFLWFRIMYLPFLIFVFLRIIATQNLCRYYTVWIFEMMGEAGKFWLVLALIKKIIVWNDIRQIMTVQTDLSSYGIIVNPRALTMTFSSLILLCLVVNSCLVTNRTKFNCQSLINCP